jgi:hypothetical protein
MACQAPTNHLEERKLRPKQSSGLFFIFLVAPPNRGTRQACFWAGRRRAPVVLPKLHFTALHNDVSKYGYFQPLACHHRESHMPGRASIGRGQERMEGPSIRNWSSRSTCTVAPLQLTRSTSSLASMGTAGRRLYATHGAPPVSPPWIGSAGCNHGLTALRDGPCRDGTSSAQMHGEPAEECHHGGAG